MLFIIILSSLPIKMIKYPVYLLQKLVFFILSHSTENILTISILLFFSFLVSTLLHLVKNKNYIISTMYIVYSLLLIFVYNIF